MWRVEYWEGLKGVARREGVRRRGVRVEGWGFCRRAEVWVRSWVSREEMREMRELWDQVV